MDAILDFEQSEIDAMLEVIKDARDAFKQNAADLCDDAFHVLTSTGAKVDNFKILRLKNSDAHSRKKKLLVHVRLKD